MRLPLWILRQFGPVGIAVALLCAGQVRADTSALADRISDLEQQAQSLQVRFQPPQVDTRRQAEQRLVDGQVLYNLNDYTRAAIVLLDYVNTYKDSPGYPDALFFLADSLYHRRDYLTARRYYREIVDRVRGPYYQDALQRLVELSLKTGGDPDVKLYLDALDRIPRSQLKSSVPYVRGKYYYFLGQTEQALRAFGDVMAGQPYHLHAQYFTGVCLVRNKQYDAALATFKAVLNAKPADNDAKKIVELTQLAVGRLLYEQNKIGEAISAYKQVSHRSDEFDAALYEIAWAYIKAKEHEKALRALDLLVMAEPDSALVPDVKVLQGNLLIRLEQWGRATNVFAETREKFTPVHERMEQLLREQQDPNVFFDALLGRSLSSGSLAIAVEVPDLAVHWVKQRPNVKRSMDLVSDVRDIEKSIKESLNLIERLRVAITSPSRIKIFPGFAVARTNAVELENRLARARNQILAREHSLVEPVLNPQERAQLARLSGERASLDQQVAQLPQDAQSFNARTDLQLKRLARLGRELSRLAVLVEDLKAQLVAAEKYFADTASAKDQGRRDSFAAEAAATRQTIMALDEEVDTLNAQLADARHAAGVGGPEEVAERQLKERYRVVTDQEHEFLLGFGGRLSGRQRADLNSLAQLMGRCDGVDTTLRLFNAKLEQQVEDKLADVRVALAEEQKAVAGYRSELAVSQADTDQVAGAITYEGFQAISKRFYDIIVRADVGIIDVAWALKDSKTKEVSRLVRQQKMDLKLLDDEFREVLGAKTTGSSAGQ